MIDDDDDDDGYDVLMIVSALWRLQMWVGENAPLNFLREINNNNNNNNNIINDIKLPSLLQKLAVILSLE